MERECRARLVILKAFFRYWLPILVWMTLIFIGSSDVLSAEHTSRFIEPLLRWLRPGISPATIAKVHLLVRKAGHVSEYAVLAVLVYRALVHTLLAGRAFASAALVLATCALYAASDEFHQSFVPSRTASPRDVMIDISGAFLAVCLYAVFGIGRTATNEAAVSSPGPERI